MGMFTSIVHPKDGRELQIKCGEDVCETFRVGDLVGQHPIPNWPMSGYLLDDVYNSYSNLGVDDFVVIKDGRVVAVEDRETVRKTILEERRTGRPIPPTLWEHLTDAADTTPWPQREEEEDDPDFVGVGACVDFLREKWAIQPPPREWWSEEAWKEHAERQEEARKERERLDAELANISPERRLGFLISRVVGRRLNYASIARSLFKVEQMPPGALSTYSAEPQPAREITEDDQQETGDPGAVRADPV